MITWGFISIKQGWLNQTVKKNQLIHEQVKRKSCMLVTIESEIFSNKIQHLFINLKSKIYD